MRGRGSVNSDEFIREVDEAVRQEQWLKLWKQYGSYITAAALALVVGSAAASAGAPGSRTSGSTTPAATPRRSSCCATDKPEEAGEAFAALAEDAHGGYRVLARLRAAEARARAGDPAAATARPGAACRQRRQCARSIAPLGELLAAQRDFANAQPDALLAQLEPLAGTDDPWRHSALELRALAQMRSGDTAAARQTLEHLLADPLTPPDLGRARGRAAGRSRRSAGSRRRRPRPENRLRRQAADEPGPAPAQEGAVAEGD